MPLLAKICGLSTVEAVDAAVEGGAAFLGFVFFPRSPRHVSPQQARELTENLPSHIKTAAVTVNMSNEELDELLAGFRPDYLQLHGKETPQRCEEVRRHTGCDIIKACTIQSADDVTAAHAYSECADYLLFDARPPQDASMLPGGNGLSFDWNILAHREFSLPWFLSGGLSAENLAEAVAITGAGMVDVSSSVERAPGEKDPALIQAFLNEVQRLDGNPALTPA